MLLPSLNIILSMDVHISLSITSILLEALENINGKYKWKNNSADQLKV